MGLEPTTSGITIRSSNQLSYAHHSRAVYPIRHPAEQLFGTLANAVPPARTGRGYHPAMPSAEIPGIDLRLPPLSSAAKIYLAFSGGLDSTVLLHLLHSLAPEKLHALHVHHGLQAEAERWAEHCARVCEHSGVTFTLLRVAIDHGDEAGPEAAARSARYAALRSMLDAGDCLAMAHHLDDQAETVLLRLLRGTGVRGLAAMRPFAEFAPGWLWRPLLEVPRPALQAYAQDNALQWVEDPQNCAPRFTRSWLRTEIVPKLRQRFPQMGESLARTARLAAEASELLDELAAADAVAAQQGDALKVSVLLQMTGARRSNLLRAWLHAQHFEMPSATHLRRITDEVLDAAESAEPCLRWPGCELHRYRDALYAMPTLPPPPGTAVLEWRAGADFALPAGCGHLRADAPPGRVLQVRYVRGGDGIRIATHTRRLKNLFQETGVPPWLRPYWPLVELDGELAGIPGMTGSQAWHEFCARTGWQARWHHPLRGAASPLAL